MDSRDKDDTDDQDALPQYTFQRVRFSLFISYYSY